MPLLPLLLLLGFLASCTAQKVENCLPDGQESILEIGFETRPHPLVEGKTFQIKFNFELKETLDNFAMSVRLSKVITGRDIGIPCVPISDDLSVGSCDYENVCAFVDKLIGDGDCPSIPALPNLEIPCRCPFDTFSISLPFALSPKIPLPAMPGNMITVVNGDYKVKLELKDRATGLPLACHSITVTLADRDEVYP